MSPGEWMESDSLPAPITAPKPCWRGARMTWSIETIS